MRLLIDQNVPDSVAQFLHDRGHEVMLVRDSIGPEAPDQLIIMTASLQGVMVVTMDKDFTHFRKLVPEGSRKRFLAGAGLLHIAVRASRASNRLAEEIDTIEFYAARAELRGKRVHIRLTQSTIQFAES